MPRSSMPRPPGASCENLAGGQMTPPRDVVGVLPLTVAIGDAGGDARRPRADPARPADPRPVTFSAAVGGRRCEARGLGGGGARARPASRERVIADSLGTPLALIPQTINTQIRLRWPVRRYLTDEDRVRATLTITARDVNLAPTVATREITLRR